MAAECDGSEKSSKISFNTIFSKQVGGRFNIQKRKYPADIIGKKLKVKVRVPALVVGSVGLARPSANQKRERDSEEEGGQPKKSRGSMPWGT